jgi:hypothetical protein
MRSQSPGSPQLNIIVVAGTGPSRVDLRSGGSGRDVRPYALHSCTAVVEDNFVCAT